MHIIYIKNMVFYRCIATVKDILNTQSISYSEVRLGEVVMPGNLSVANQQQLGNALEKVGFTILDDKKAALISRIKSCLVTIIYNNEERLKVNHSELLSKELGHEYGYLSHLFSTTENTTIEKFTIQLKIERIKELLMYDELTLTEIADKLHYSSTSALSNQFKKVTGFTPSYFKQLRNEKRISLDELTDTKSYNSKPK